MEQAKKCVLVETEPTWWELIISGERDYIVTEGKNAPSESVPFNCYFADRRSRLVVGQFVCKKIEVRFCLADEAKNTRVCDGKSEIECDEKVIEDVLRVCLNKKQGGCYIWRVSDAIVFEEPLAKKALIDASGHPLLLRKNNREWRYVREIHGGGTRS